MSEIRYAINEMIFSRIVQYDKLAILYFFVIQILIFHLLESLK